jgi:hypothetical protein
MMTVLFENTAFKSEFIENYNKIKASIKSLQVIDTALPKPKIGSFQKLV